MSANLRITLAGREHEVDAGITAGEALLIPNGSGAETSSRRG